MKYYEYNKLYQTIENIIKKQEHLESIVAKSVIPLQNSALNTYLKSITTSLNPIINDLKYQQIIDNMSHISNIIIQNNIEDITSIIYNSLKTCNYDTLQKLQNVFTDSDISNISLENITSSENGSVSYENNTFSLDEIKDNTSELLLKASTGTIEYSDIIKNPGLVIPLIIIFYIIFTLIIPDLYNAAKKYVKDTYFSDKAQIVEEDYKNFRIVTTDVLNVRRNHSIESDIIGNLYYLNVVKILETYPYWIKIEYLDSTNNIKITGWISKKYTSDFSQETENLFNLNEK